MIMNRIRNLIERLAVRYLERHGRVVLPRIFIGFAVGYGQATKTGESYGYDLWEVSVPHKSWIVAVNHSIVVDGTKPVVFTGTPA